MIEKELQTLLEITNEISCALSEEGVLAEEISCLIEKREDVINRLKEYENLPKDILREILEIDAMNAKQINVILETLANKLRDVSARKKQISYVPRQNYNEGLFVDKKS